MKIDNLDTGLRRTLVAAFRSKGLSKAAADAKASKHLPTARTHFNEKLAGSEKAAKAAKVAEVVRKAASSATAAEKLRSIQGLRDRSGETLADSPRAISAAMRSVAVLAKTL